jgi:membrane associated rhomboid family serine protease
MFPLKDNIPLSRFPIVTVTLVAINVVGYLLAIRHGGSFFGGPAPSVAVHYGAIPYEFTHAGSHCYPVSFQAHLSSSDMVVCQRHPEESLALLRLGRTPPAQPATWQTAFTSMFLQGSFLPIFANMLFLVLFGPTVEDSMGRGRFVIFYLLGGLVALGAHLLAVPNSANPELGAAGAITAVLGGYILLHRHARILSIVPIPFFVTIVAVPALALVVFWFAMQLALSLAGLTSPLGGVDGGAHIGAFAFGLVAVRLFVGLGRGSVDRHGPPSHHASPTDQMVAGTSPRA